MALAILAAGPSNLPSFTELELLFLLLESLSFLELEWGLDLKEHFIKDQTWHALSYAYEFICKRQESTKLNAPPQESADNNKYYFSDLLWVYGDCAAPQLQLDLRNGWLMTGRGCWCLALAAAGLFLLCNSARGH